MLYVGFLVYLNTMMGDLWTLTRCGSTAGQTLHVYARLKTSRWMVAHRFLLQHQSCSQQQVRCMHCIQGHLLNPLQG